MFSTSKGRKLTHAITWMILDNTVEEHAGLKKNAACCVTIVVLAEEEGQLAFKQVQGVSFVMSSGAGRYTLAQKMNIAKIIQRVTPPPRTPHHLSKLQPSICSTTEYIHNPDNFVFILNINTKQTAVLSN